MAWLTCLAMLVSVSGQAAGLSATFRVGLILTADCSVDSASLRSQAEAGKLGASQAVACNFRTPHSVQVEKQAAETPLQEAYGPAPGSSVTGAVAVLTLTF